MTTWPTHPDWQLQWDNPDFRGWSVVAAYVFAAGCCARAALRGDGRRPEKSQSSGIWWLLASGLLFLGINKQLNLQTLFIVLAGRAASAGGWYGRRRQVQMVFSAAFALAGLCSLWLLRARFRQFFARNPWVFAGLTVLLVFVLIRTASINHVFEVADRRYDGENADKRWTWALEMGGSACLAVAAGKARREAEGGWPG